MLRMGFALAFGIALLAGTAGNADAAKRAKMAKTDLITLRGCAHTATPFCTIMNTETVTYSLTEASPPLPVETGITVVGEKTAGPTVCSGMPLKVVKWSRTRMKCPQ